MDNLDLTRRSILFLEDLIVQIQIEDSMYNTAKTLDDWFVNSAFNTDSEGLFAPAYNKNLFMTSDEYQLEINEGLSFTVMEVYKLAKSSICMKMQDCESPYEMSISFERFVIYRSQLLDIQQLDNLNIDEDVLCRLLIDAYSIAIEKYLLSASNLKSGYYGINYTTKKVSIGVGSNTGDIEGIPTKVNRALLHIFIQCLNLAKKGNYTQHIRDTRETISDKLWSFTYSAGL